MIDNICGFSIRSLNYEFYVMNKAICEDE